ncbi:MAG TPA: right-handed parallel beta-helix repeat-containing protein, partial [Gaiellaceae bacterium]
MCTVAGLVVPANVGAAVFTVTATDDTNGVCYPGDCSLREAIKAANAADGLDYIHFDIYPGGAKRIKPLKALPALTGPTVVDGTTQPGFYTKKTPIIELDGRYAGAGANGLIVGGSSTVRGLVINRFLANGIAVAAGATGVTIEGNYLGTDPSGTLDAGNCLAGVFVGPAAVASIGGTTPLQRNLISGNQTGITLDGAGGASITGNYIGTTASGGWPLGNALSGVVIDDTPGVTVGGSADGAGNVISGNGANGIAVSGLPSAAVIAGNLIGTGASGTVDVGNAARGVSVVESPNSVIGGAGAARNVISGNDGGGLAIVGDGASGNLVQGNSIGLAIDGATALGNGGPGVLLQGPSNTIGGAGAGLGNVISANAGAGISISTLQAAGNTVRGNVIGTSAAGTARPNADGVVLVNGASGNTIGDALAGAGNLISRNLNDGIRIQASGNVVLGNRIGTTPDGTKPAPNAQDGVEISSAGSAVSGNLIGGTEPGAQNLISGNGANGVRIQGPAVSTNTVIGNRIGLDIAGGFDLGNAGSGVLVDGASSNTIDDNLVGGNDQGGVGITGGSAASNVLTGNRIGVNDAGTATVPNTGQGIHVFGGSDGNTIGGTNDGEANVVAASTQHGVLVSAGSTGNTILGNLIGTNSAGTADFGNAREGVRIEGDSNTVGGTAPGARNLLSGNGGFGVLLYGSSGNVVQGNYAGTDITGTVAIANGLDGVGVDGGSSHLIGGTAPGAGNLTSGNGNQGIAVFGVDFPSTTGSTVVGNLVGTQADGSSPLGNGGDGVRLLNASNTTVGGPSAEAANTIAYNGTDLDGAGDGVVVFGSGSQNTIRGNSIFENGDSASDLGIDLGADGVTANDGGDEDAGANGLANFPIPESATSITGFTAVKGAHASVPPGTYRLEFFSSPSCDTSGNGEGKTLLGRLELEVTLIPESVFFDHAFAVDTPVGHVVTATATDAAGNTSEFSPCVDVESGVPPDATIALDSDVDAAIAGAQRVPIAGIPTAALTQPDPNTQAAPLDAIPLDAIDLEASPLDAIPLDAIGLTANLLQEALGGVHLSDLPVSTPGGWEALLQGTALANVPLSTITLADVYADAAAKSSIAGVPLDAIDFSATPLDAIPLAGLALGATPLDAIPLDAIGTNDPAENAADWCAAINAIDGYACPPLDPSTETLIGLAIRGVPLDAIPLDAIPLDAIGDLVDCTGGFCAPGTTLGDAAAASRLVPGATLGELVAALEPGSGATLAHLIYGLPSTVIVDGETIRLTLRELFALLLGNADYDWADLNLDEFPLSDFATEGGIVTYEATFTVTGGTPSATATIHATLPEGGRYVAGSTELLKAGVPQTIGEPDVMPASLEWEAEVDIDDEYVLRWKARPGLELGTSAVNANIIVPGMTAASFAEPKSLEVLQTLENNDSPAAARELSGGSLYITHLPRADEDYLKIPIPPAGSRVVVEMTHLEADFDLLVFGPEAPPLRAAPLDAIPLGNPPIVDVEALLDSRNESLPPETLQDLPLDAIATQTLRAVSDNRGTASERIEILSQGESGFYTLLAAPFEDAESNSPFMLEVEVVGPAALGPCAPRTPASFPFAGQGTPGLLPDLTALPANLNTVFLVNAKRLGDTFGSAATSTLLAQAGALAGRADLGVVGAVIPVDGNGAVATAYDTWDGNPCSPEHANAVVTAIGAVLDDVIDPPGPTPPRPVENVVLVGGDDLIPMGRVPDETEIANERGYASTFAGPANQYLGALANGLLMTDDVYGERATQTFLGRELFVPELSVGRLVESAPEIGAQLQQFIDSGGVMDPDSSLVTGYDFLGDGARAINAPFAPRFGAAASTLINETWDRDELLAALFPTTGPGPDINSINAHFDHRRGLPADQNLLQREDELFTSQSFRNDFGANALSERLILSIGCHAGFPVSDALLGSGNALAVDWAQTFALRGAFGSVLNTGYGLGDTVDVAYSELLHALISRGLDGTQTIGEAIRFAKHEYLSTRPALGLYDQKVSVETTLYGLPMYEVGADGATPEEPDPLPTVTDSATGLTAAPFDVNPTFEEVLTDDGVFLRAEAGSWATNRRPIQPLFELNATQPNQVAHGALMTGLTSTDEAVDAVFSRAVFDDSEDEPEVVGEGSHPARLQAITSFDSRSGPRQRLLLTVGQFRTDGVPDPEGFGIQRRFTNLQGRIYYAAPGEQDFRPARLGPVTAFEVGSTVGFALDVEDRDEAGEPGIVRRVVALYRDCSSVWKLAELSKDPESNRWSGGGPVGCNTIDYFIQAVDGAGNVAITHKKALLETIIVPETVGTIAAVCNEAPCAGWYTGDVAVTLTSSTPGVAIEYSVDGEPFQPYSEAFIVTGDGVHAVDFRGSDGSHGTVVPAIDTTDPTVEMTTPAPNAVYVLGSVVNADYTCADAGSGAQSCVGTPASGQPLDTSSAGEKSISVTATDAVGHTFTLTRT